MKNGRGLTPDRLEVEIRKQKRRREKIKMIMQALADENYCTSKCV